MMNTLKRNFTKLACAAGTGYCFNYVLTPLVGPTYARVLGVGIACFTVAILPYAPESKD